MSQEWISLLVSIWAIGGNPAACLIVGINSDMPPGCEPWNCPRTFVAALFWPIGIPVMLVQLYRRRRRPALPRAVVR